MNKTNKLTGFDLISGADIFYNNITIRQPTLGMIRDKIGSDLYYSYLNIIVLNKETLLDAEELQINYNQISKEDIDSLSIFNLILIQPVLRELLMEALSFFICENIVFDSTHFCYLVLDDEDNCVDFINDENYQPIQTAIKKINCIDSEDDTPKKFKGKKAKKIFERCQSGSKAFNQTKKVDKNMSLDNIISSVCIQHNSYNLLNIWDLTIYQLYDQFARLNIKNQVDISSLKWAAWGTEPFDFSIWYKNINLNK